MMRTRVYQKKDTVTDECGQGKLYQFLCLAREHTTGKQAVVYVPLRVEPEWEGTVRFCYIPREDFEQKFEYVDEGLPVPVERQ